MEGILAEECYKQAADEGCKVEVVWQDDNSSAGKAIINHHPDGKVYKCGGHVGRAHVNQLNDAAKKKDYSADIKRKYKDCFPLVLSVKCKCQRHKAGCGCLSENVLTSACVNHFCCLQQCEDPQEYARCIESPWGISLSTNLSTNLQWRLSTRSEFPTFTS